MADYVEMSDEEKKEAQEYIKKFEKMRSDRSVWESHWQECYDYIVPRKNDVTTERTAGEKRNTDLFDTTAIMSNQLLSGALHGMLTNPATRFFELIMGNPALDGEEEIKAWLQEVGERMFILLNNTNFQTEIHEVYIDLGAIGTSCLYMGEHASKIVHFGARSIKENYIEENNLGLIDVVYRKFKWKPRQVVQEFGVDKLPTWVVEQYKKGCDDDWEIIHAVHPAKDTDETREVFPFKS